MLGLDSTCDNSPHHVAVPVSVFKTAITLEASRRDNDQKVIALYERVYDMMQVMTL